MTELDGGQVLVLGRCGGGRGGRGGCAAGCVGCGCHPM